MSTKEDLDLGPPLAPLVMTLELPAELVMFAPMAADCLYDLARAAVLDPLGDDLAECLYLKLAAGLMKEVGIRAAVAKAHPLEAEQDLAAYKAAAAGAKQKVNKAPEEKPTMKVKHQYDKNGICSVDHGQGKCGKVRERKPRAGSQAEALAHDGRTLTIPGTAPESLDDSDNDNGAA